MPSADGFERVAAAQSASSFGRNAAGSRPASVRPKRSRDLAREDDDRDARGEADRHGMRDVLDVGSEPQEADREQDTPAISVARKNPSKP